jgi:hypothetical protein
MTKVGEPNAGEGDVKTPKENATSDSHWLDVRVL